MKNPKRSAVEEAERRVYLIGLNHEAKYWADEWKIPNKERVYVSRADQLCGLRGPLDIRKVGRWWFLGDYYRIEERLRIIECDNTAMKARRRA